MELYTLLSISIGIFGATFASLNAFKSNFENLIKAARETSAKRVALIEKQHGATNTYTIHARECAKGIERCEKGWVWANRVPAMIFAFFMFYIGFFIVTQWELIDAKASAAPATATVEAGVTNNVPSKVNSGTPELLAMIKTKHPWCHMRFGVTGLFLIDLVCVIGALIAWLRCRGRNNQLDMIHKGAEDLQKRNTAGAVTAETPTN